MNSSASAQDNKFNGQTVLVLESRMAGPMGRLIEKLGGVSQIAPSLKEVPLTDNPPAFDFFEKLEQGSFDLLILMTGVGLRYLLKTLEGKYPKDRIVRAFEKTQVVVRGPKPTQVCKVNGIPISITVPPPNTWQEILQILTEENLLQGKHVGLLEYGTSDENFLEELRSRGAKVTPTKIYKWELPEDISPLRQAIADMIEGTVDLLLQTSAVQIDHLLQVTQDKWEELELRRALARVAIFSIGPTTSTHLRELQIFPDHEVFPNKWEHLIEEAARHGERIVRTKRRRAQASWVRVDAPMPLDPDSLMMKACRREPVDRIPIWLMRQAGRYMAEYQLIRRGMNFLEFCKTPELTTEATLTAVERLGVDAAILFADILPLLEPMGMELAFREGEGPVIGTPLREAAAIEKLKPVEPEQDLPFVFETIRQIRRRMDSRIPLIGFSGAPFTLASYMIEGRGSRNYLPTKTLMHSEPEAWHWLMEHLTQAVVDYLRAQVNAGCQILQVFDSWVGCLSPTDYQTWVFPHMQRLFQELPAEVPTIHFGTGTATLLAQQRQAGGDVIGLDWRMDLAGTWDQLGEVGIQGNFDPVLLFSPIEVIQAEAERILRAVGSRPGFIFNLGHGILPETPVDHVMALVDFVHGWKISSGG